MESVGYAKVLGEEFWKKHGEKLSEKAQKQAEDMAEAERIKRKDPSVIGELIKRLEAKMLPVPGTEILLSKTEFTVGEWKLYWKAEGYPEWQQPDPKEFMQTDEHPVVKVSWNDAMKFCEWLSKVSGKRWRLPKEAEWDAAGSGNSVGSAGTANRGGGGGGSGEDGNSGGRGGDGAVFIWSW